MTIRQNAFGFNYGDCSFTDLIVKPSELYLAENPKLNQPGSSIELFIYLCNYRSIYVMGTRPGVKEEAAGLEPTPMSYRQAWRERLI